VGQLSGFESKSDVNPEALIAANLVREGSGPIVLLGEGEIDTALNVRVHRVSKGARAKIESSGGSVEIITQQDSE